MLELRGSNLRGALVFVEVGSSRGGLGQPDVSTELLHSGEDCLLVKVRPGLGTRTTLMLENSYGKTCFAFAYKGERREVRPVDVSEPHKQTSLFQLLLVKEAFWPFAVVSNVCLDPWPATSAPVIQADWFVGGRLVVQQTAHTETLQQARSSATQIMYSVFR